MGHQLLGRRHFPKEPPADGVEPPNDESGVIHRSNALGLHEGPPSGRVAPASSLPPAWLLVSQIGGGERLSSRIARAGSFDDALVAYYDHGRPNRRSSRLRGGSDGESDDESSFDGQAALTLSSLRLRLA